MEFKEFYDTFLFAEGATEGSPQLERAAKILYFGGAVIPSTPEEAMGLCRAYQHGRAAGLENGAQVSPGGPVERGHIAALEHPGGKVLFDCHFARRVQDGEDDFAEVRRAMGTTLGTYYHGNAEVKFEGHRDK